MSDAAEASDKADFEARVQRYIALGFTNERTVHQLIRTGYPIAQIKARFPEVPAHVFEQLPVPQRRTARLIEAAKSGAGERVKVNQTSVVPVPQPPPIIQVIERLKAQTQASGEIVAGDGISFHYVPLIQCSFPHGDPGEVTVFSRKNGWLELKLAATRPGTGLPYGVPARLLTIYCASEAIRSRSPEIYLGTSVNEFLNRLDIPITRGERGSLQTYTDQLWRLIHCALTIDENIRDANGRTGLHLRQTLFAEEARLWSDKGHQIGQGSSLILSSVLFNSILERSAPLSTDAIKRLRKSPMDLDVYAWLVHRLFQLRRQSTISWEQLSGQFGHNYAEPRYFRRSFLDSLKRVHAVYPEAKFKVSGAGLTLLPSRPHVAHS